MRGNYRHQPGDLGAHVLGGDRPGAELEGRYFHQLVQHQPVARELIPPIVAVAAPRCAAERVAVARPWIAVVTGPRCGHCGAGVSRPVTPGPGSAVARSGTPGGTR